MNLTRFLTRATLFALLFASTSLAQSQVTRPDPPKSDDAARVGLVTPRVSLLGGGGSVPQETNSLRQNLSSFLTGPRIGTIDIRAKLDSLALEEAKERGCDYVLYVALTRKRPAAARGSGGSFGGGTKTGDEFTFDFKVVAVGGTQGTVERTLKGTAASDGQDVVTAMIETAAQVVVELARQARPAVAEAKVNSDPVVQPKTPAPAPASAEPAPEPIPTGYGSLSATPKSSSTSSRNNDPAKGEGVIRIGIVTPRVTSAGSGIGGNSEANSLRTTFTSFLAGSNIETIDLKARLEGLAITEAQRRQCDFVLYTTLVRKRAGSSSGGVGTKIPGAKTVKDVTSEAARVSSTLASFARANDEVTFEYKLVTSAGAKPIAGKSTKAKVKNDGEDVLTPMIESAAQTIVDATIKP